MKNTSKQSWKQQTTNSYRCDWLVLNMNVYNKCKIDNSFISFMKDEMDFSKYNAIYDIAMDIFCECGADINHEDIIKHIEFLYERDLYHFELVDYVQAINDYQN